MILLYLKTKSKLNLINFLVFTLLFNIVIVNCQVIDKNMNFIDYGYSISNDFRFNENRLLYNSIDIGYTWQYKGVLMGFESELASKHIQRYKNDLKYHFGLTLLQIGYCINHGKRFQFPISIGFGGTDSGYFTNNSQIERIKSIYISLNTGIRLFLSQKIAISGNIKLKGNALSELNGSKVAEGDPNELGNTIKYSVGLVHAF